MKQSKQLSRLFIFCFSIFVAFAFSCGNKNNLSESNKSNKNSEFVLLSAELLNAVKANNAEKTNSIQKKLEQVNEDSLAIQVNTEQQKKAFWINVYNANIQILLNKNPSLLDDRGKFFGTPRITIANNKLSFDDIEHGIIRSSKLKLSLGLIRNPFANSFEKKFRTKNTDGRVHFALNCGAKSCPLVAVYDAEQFDNKINQVAKHFLQKVSTYKIDKNEVITTPLFSWFRGDFNGKSGVLSYLKSYGVVPEDEQPTISYDEYDWTLSLGNYYEAN